MARMEKSGHYGQDSSLTHVDNIKVHPSPSIVLPEPRRPYEIKRLKPVVSNDHATTRLLKLLLQDPLIDDVVLYEQHIRMSLHYRFILGLSRHARADFGFGARDVLLAGGGYGVEVRIEGV